MRILVTGMSGVGKSTLLEAMASRGFLTVDTDYGDWETELGYWREDRMDALLSDQTDCARHYSYEQSLWEDTGATR